MPSAVAGPNFSGVKVTDLAFNPRLGAPEENMRNHLVAELSARRRFSAVIRVDLKDHAGTLTFHGKFHRFISCVPPPAP